MSFHTRSRQGKLTERIRLLEYKVAFHSLVYTYLYHPIYIYIFKFKIKTNLYFAFTSTLGTNENYTLVTLYANRRKMPQWN